MVDEKILEYFLGEDDWLDLIYDTTIKWHRLLDNKYEFAQNHDHIDLGNYVQLVEKTYDIIEKSRYACIKLNEETVSEYRKRKNWAPDDEYYTTLRKVLIRNYTEIVSSVRAYSILECFTDNPDYKISAVIARYLYPVLVDCSLEKKAPILTMSFNDGEFMSASELSRKETNKKYTYNIKEYDLADVTAFAEKVG
ncbi:MAG: hypothetical protein ACI4XE_06575 [Acutalibacteraceae bacterium]